MTRRKCLNKAIIRRSGKVAWYSDRCVDISCWQNDAVWEKWVSLYRLHQLLPLAVCLSETCANFSTDFRKNIPRTEPVEYPATQAQLLAVLNVSLNPNRFRSLDSSVRRVSTYWHTIEVRFLAWAEIFCTSQLCPVMCQCSPVPLFKWHWKIFPLPKTKIKKCLQV